MPEKIRQAFENWMTDNGAFPNAVARNPGGSYVLQQTRISWEAWQASATEAAKERL